MNAPKLRFKEFNDELSNHKFKDICTFFSGGTPTSSNKEYYNGDIPFIRSGEIYSDNTELFINQDAINNSSAKVVNKGDLLLALYGATSGNVAISKIDGAINQAILCINPQYGYSKIYIKYLLENKKETILKTFLQGGQGNLSAEIIKSLNYSFPQIEEQEKIGDFLSLLDKKIELQSKKIEDLKLFKLSKYSSVFSKTNNKIKLSDICIIEKGKQINSDLLIEKGNYYMLNGGILPSGYLNEYNTNENTVTISEGGNSCGYVNFNKTKFWCGGHCYKIISPSVNTSYLYHLLKYNEKIIMDLRVGSGLPNIQKKDLEALKLSIHKNDEQLKIGILFDTFDKKISLETDKLNKFKELKKALMQVMFV